MGQLSNSQILKGSAIEVFFGNDNLCPGFATEHSLSINVETLEISTKSHGDFSSVLPQRITWTLTCNNLMSDDAEQVYMEYTQGMQDVHVKFAKVANYNGYGDEAERGIVGPNGRDGWVLGDIIAEGDALITTMDLTATAGENATLSIQLQGTTALTTPTTNSLPSPDLSMLGALNLNTGSTASVAVVNPHSVSPITYTSSATSVATVNGSGVVTGTGTGTAYVSATFNGNASYKPQQVSCKVNVA